MHARRNVMLRMQAIIDQNEIQEFAGEVARTVVLRLFVRMHMLQVVEN